MAKDPREWWGIPRSRVLMFVGFGPSMWYIPWWIMFFIIFALEAQMASLQTSGQLVYNL